MRVVAGSAGGIPLLVPKTDLRPTMDMVRNALFSSLGDLVINAHVIDLFAGSGSLGIEALSRGASTATFVESDRKACAVIHQNLEKTRLAGRVIHSDVFRYLNSQAQSEPATIVLADPPYSKLPNSRDFCTELITSPFLPKLISPDGLLVLEVVRGWITPDTLHWELLRRKTYGSTEVLLLSRRSP